MTIPIQRCFCFFSLRQGTMLIGLLVLLLSAFCLFLLLLGSAHAHEMTSLLEADLEDSMHREGFLLTEERSKHFESSTNPQNDLMFHRAQHLAVLVIVWLYLGVALATIHLVFCILLLYGTIMRIRQLLLPWMCITMFGLILCSAGMVVSMYLAEGYEFVAIFIFASFFILIGFYFWLVVYSHYVEMCTLKATACSIRHHMINEGYFNFLAKASDV
ncbi:hypothetical protein AAG570_012361 [Ranatra chinensis]|uniref:Transmembrane protein n=1 Tax=Ranatra chinensis TaxID=642074 RepID=A0ABD0YIY4_9HEMI